MSFSPLATKYTTEEMHTVIETQSKKNGISDPTKRTGVLQSLSFGKLSGRKKQTMFRLQKDSKRSIHTFQQFSSCPICNLDWPVL